MGKFIAEVIRILIIVFAVLMLMSFIYAGRYVFAFIWLAAWLLFYFY